jgi:hypothetical protein
MPKTRNTHWGHWIQRRARFCGLFGPSQLARAVGCTRPAALDWWHSEEPQEAMRKGHNEALAAILKTDRFTLFTAYRNVAPESAPLLSREMPSRDEPLRRRAHAIADLLDADRLRDFTAMGERMLHGEASPSNAA